ncbi:hypothetical protein [Poriferisphaera sp. WC338]|uniref:hypothetical protein n=1 Tax=Poriferisphaera sp. WC338 TaxID=3425129 RepID=UPI003D812B2C
MSEFSKNIAAIERAQVPKRVQRISTLLLVLAVFALVWFCWALIEMSIAWPEPRNQTVDAGLLWPYWLSYAAVWVLLSLGVWYWTTRHHHFMHPVRAFWLIFLIALVPRLLVVFATQPTLSDDIWRYIYDGSVLSSGGNPYQTAPADVPATQVAEPEVHKRINHPQLVTIYQPISQYVFAIVSLFKVQTWDAWGDKTFRFAFILFDLGIVLLLLGYCAKAGKSLWYGVLYAWHPLPIAEVAGSGHQDVLGILPFLGALIVYESQKKTLTRAIISGKLFAISLAVKPIILPVFFPMVWWLRKDRKRFIGIILAAIKTTILVFIPFLILPGGIYGMVETGRTFVEKWSNNGSLYPIVYLMTGGSKDITDLIMGVALLAVVILGMRYRVGLFNLAIVFVLVTLLFSSTVHPWYLLWMLALVPLSFNWAAWVFSLTISWSYVAHVNTEGYWVLPEVVGAEYLPVYVLALLGVWQWFKQVRQLGLRRPKEDDLTYD